MDSATKQEKLADLDYLIAVETARKRIKNAVLVTVLTGVAIPIAWLVGQLVANIAGYDSARSGAGFYWILEVLFIFGMGYGISRYSLLCSRLMFGYLSVSVLHGLFTGGFTSYGLYCKIGALYFLWIGIDAMQTYQLLTRKECSLAVDKAVNGDLDRSQTDRPVDEDTLQPRSTTTELLNPTPELISLCGGDRSQAQWLLSKVKSKHPDRSVEWCNQQVVDRLTT
ncbi:hypothetical protein [Chamaesiphon sp. VAR_69_metabat_338]|uniref:hypothetical protein n=1 Tax=Chamaesiphon sp. VAR_69_metabat_338 TaxID=2964704 RepID=UPI00286E4AD2|nr:hypothetical protein [Chamaesiphon sp. VAR_69_metabat_338]